MNQIYSLKYYYYYINIAYAVFSQDFVLIFIVVMISLEFINSSEIDLWTIFCNFVNYVCFYW